MQPAPGVPSPAQQMLPNVEWTGQVNVNGEIATTTVKINGEDYTITYRGRTGEQLGEAQARQILANQMDAMVIIGTRYLGGNTNSVTWDPTNNTIERHYVRPGKGGRKKAITQLNSGFERFDDKLGVDRVKHIGKVQTLSRQPPGPNPDEHKDAVKYRNEKIERIDKAQRLFEAYKRKLQPRPASQPASQQSSNALVPPSTLLPPPPSSAPPPPPAAASQQTPSPLTPPAVQPASGPTSPLGSLVITRNETLAERQRREEEEARRRATAPQPQIQASVAPAPPQQPLQSNVATPPSQTPTVTPGEQKAAQDKTRSLQGN